MDRWLEIDKFAVPWAQQLPSLIGSSEFRLEQSPEPQSPNGWRPNVWLGILSSHTHKLDYVQADWQASLDSALQLANQQAWGILCASDAPYFDVVAHACKRLNIPYREIRTASASPHRKSSNSHDHETLWLRETDGYALPPPLHDRAVAFLSHQLFVIQARKHGKVASLLETRLSQKHLEWGTTYLSLPRNLDLSGGNWLDQGAVGWLSTYASLEPRPSSTQSHTPSNLWLGHSHYQPILPLRLLASTANRYLIHCTRSRSGPWPDQTRDQFHDELLQSPWPAPPTVLTTLTRILSQSRLIATHQYRRGNKDTVCFSGKELHELLAMRQFRSHLGRWDWEPYGLLIGQRWLIAHGAKPVRYIDRSQAKLITEDEWTYCQTVSDATQGIDWRIEHEWRIPGDIRLSQIPFSEALVFVPTMEEARSLVSLSRWPIVVLTPF